MSSSVVLRGRGPLSRSVRCPLAADVPTAMTTGLEDHGPPGGLAHHVRLRAPGVAEDEAPARLDDVALPNPARIAEDIQLDLRARLRGRTDP
jgi:hypothetical protein